MIHVAQIEELTVRIPSARGSSLWVKLVMSSSTGASMTAGVGSNSVVMANAASDVRRALADLRAAADRIESELNRFYPPIQQLEAVLVERENQSVLPAGCGD